MSTKTKSAEDCKDCNDLKHVTAASTCTSSCTVSQINPTIAFDSWRNSLKPCLS